MKLDLSKFNTEIHESLLDPEYAFDIQKKFERGLNKNIPEILKDYDEINDQIIQAEIDRFKSWIVFEVLEILGNLKYKGRVIKKGPVAYELGKEDFFATDKKLTVGEIYFTPETLYINELLSELKLPKINIEPSFENPLEDMSDEFDIPVISSSEGNCDKMMKRFILINELCKLDESHVDKVLKQLNVDMRMYQEINNHSNPKIILKALSFYDEMRSDKKIRTVETSKPRQTHEQALNMSASHYEIDPSELQKWIGKRNGFSSRKI